MGKGRELWVHDSVAAVDLVQGNLKILFFRMETKTRLGALVLEVGEKGNRQKDKAKEGTEPHTESRWEQA